jgi:hypothetical protein
MSAGRVSKERAMIVRYDRRQEGERGQALVLMVGVILVSVALLALIVDGGNVVSQQRVSQTGSDSAAEAGAIILAQRFAGAAAPTGGWDAAIDARIHMTATANHMQVKAAYYTDICGIPLKADGTAALNADHSEDLASALQIGNPGGNLPAGNAGTPDCPSLTVGPVAGALVIAERSVPSYIARAINIPSFRVTTRATAVSGYLEGYCDASQGVWCAVLPITIPGFVPSCASNGTLNGGSQNPWVTGVVYRIGLCKNDPGNVGWLDWSPPGGGANEVVCEIVNPNNPAILLPSWQNVTATGNTNGGGPCTDANTGTTYSGVEDALRKYDGQVVLIPQFSAPTCNPGPHGTPNQSQVSLAPNYGCAPSDQNGNGQNQWYRFTSFAFLELCSPTTAGCGGLHGAYIQGNNQAVCQQGNGQTGCLVGKLVDILGSGTVGPGSGSGTGNKAVGVQLIK